MNLELKMLAWAIVLGIVQLLAAAAGMTAQRGSKWNASARDGTPAPLTGIPARLERALRNFLETFPFFAAAVLAVVLMHRTGGWSALAVQLYVSARVVYLPLYVLGIPYIRSLVWVVSMVGIGILVLVMLA
jgi:uncharacterized MAPEG superfamily protein